MVPQCTISSEKPRAVVWMPETTGVNSPHKHPKLILRILAMAFVAFGCARVVATYHVFSPTFDEAGHIEAGLEWWDQGSYSLEPHHTPLARIAVALGPYSAGWRSLEINRRSGRDRNVVYTRDPDMRTLALARAGTLPFFILGALAVWLLSRRLFDERTAAVAVGLFTFIPSVLAHSGLATTDIPLAATFTALLYVFMRWLDAPGWRCSVLLGAAGALAVGSKFSAILFFGVSITPILTTRRISRERDHIDTASIDSYQHGILLALLTAILVLWALYRFAVGEVGGVPVLMPQLFTGMRDVAAHNAIGHRAYLLGHTSTNGWWYFFPVVLAVKTPISLLILSGIGIVMAVEFARRTGDWRATVPAFAAATILVVVLPIRINLGVRHILPLYSLLSILSAHALVALWKRGRLSRSIAVIAAAWFALGSLRAHPDYLAYFNEIASQHPERVLVESDLDWGQDLLRLRDTVRGRRIQSLSVAYFGQTGLRRYGLPNATSVAMDDSSPQPVGWFAISQTNLQFDRFGPNDKFKATMPGRYAWLRSRQPVARVGKSILLFYIPRTVPASKASQP